MFTKAEDLAPGQVYTAANQGMNITPHAITVRVHWVAPDRVHYQTAPIRSEKFDPEIKETSIERFLEIINQPRTWEP